MPLLGEGDAASDAALAALRRAMPSARLVLLTARIVGSTGPDDLRRHAEEEDEGVALILILAALAVELLADGLIKLFPVLAARTVG